MRTTREWQQLLEGAEDRWPSRGEAVAEIVRLRQGMEKLEGLINENLANIVDVGEHEWYIAPYQDIAEAIRTILEGEK